MSRFDARLASDLWFFVAAAEYRTLEQAASQLAVTQSAVTQRIRRLEERLNIPLFTREGRRLKLTMAGATLAAAASQGFAGMQEALMQVEGASWSPVVKLTCVPSLAAEWLTPALTDLYLAHPRISVAVFSEMEPPNRRRMKAQNTDIAICYGLKPPAELRVLHAVTEPVFPVAAPELALQIARNPGMGVTLLHDAQPWIEDASSTAEWDHWMARFGALVPPANRHDQFFNTAHLACGAASTGNGVALGRQLVVFRLLSEGRLVRVTDDPPLTDFSYFIVTARETLSAEVQIVADWLTDHMRAVPQ